MPFSAVFRLIFETQSLTEPADGWLRWTGCKPTESFCLCLANSGIPYAHFQGQLCVWVLGIRTQCLMLAQQLSQPFLLSKDNLYNTCSHRESLTKQSPRVQYNHTNIECFLISTTFLVLNSIRPGQDVLRSLQRAKVHFHSWMYIWKLLLSFVIDIVEYTTLKGHGQTTLGLLPLRRPMNDALCSGVHVLCNKKIFLRRMVGVLFSLCSGVLRCLL